MSKGKEYEVDIFDVKSMQGLYNVFDNLEEVVNSEEYMQFIADKCKKELEDIMDIELKSENYTTDYRTSNKYNVEPNKLEIINDSMVDLSDVSEKTLANYPNGLSLALLVEFGTGIPRNRQ